MRKIRRGFALFTALLFLLAMQGAALAYQPGTLHSGMEGEEVKEMQTALIQLGYLGGTPDGVFGTNTEKAVRKFQRANRLTADGLAGAKTLEILYQKARGASSGAGSSSGSSSSSDEASGRSSASSAGSTSVPGSDSSSGSGSGLFGGDYGTMRLGSTGNRVAALQKALISLGYLSGRADGKYGVKTRQAVIAFQKGNQLTADGLAGRTTLLTLENGGAKASATPASGDSSSSGSGGNPSGKTASGPSGAEVKLLHWYNDVKPKLRYKQILYIYEPKSGLSWNLRVYSRGRHLDAEPVTADDTAIMLQAFGGKNTWNQKGVYVQLPNGTWTIGSTHTMPHLSGSVSDNNFDGHLCVHFFRDMSECEVKDPNYGVANQRTIRSFWKSITGEVITD